MKKISILMVVLALFQIMFFANATQSFSVSPTSFSQNVNASSAGQGTFTITNTGDELINLTLTKVNFVSGSNSFTLNLGTTSITNLAVSGTQSVTYTYTSSAVAGTYSGSIIVTNSGNASITTTIPVTLTVGSTSLTGASLDLVNEGSTVIMYASLDERKTKTLKLKNDGTVDFTNVRVSVSDLDAEDSSDQIDSSDVDINDDGFNLDAGDSDTFEVEVDVPRNIDIDTYVGTLTVTTDQGFTQDYTLKVVTSGEDVNVIIEENKGDARSGLLIMVGEPGDTLKNYDIVVSNDGDIDVKDLVFEVDGALKEEFASGKTIPASAVTFIPGSLDLDSGDDDTVEVRVDVPEAQLSGNYFADIKVRSNTGELYDSIRLKVKVTGDVYFKTVTLQNETLPGDNLEVKVVIKNQGSQLYRNVKLTGVLFDVDAGSSDITESSSTFLLDVGQEKTQSLVFKIPKDASDSSHTLELRLDFGDEQIVDVESVNVIRPAHNIVIDSFGINPTIVNCNDPVYTYMKIKNLGKYDEDMKVVATIQGTSITKSTNTLDLTVDDVVQKNLVLDVSTLKPGDYKVIQKVIYADNLFVSREMTLKINSCESTGVVIKPINETEVVSGNNDNFKEDTVSILGKDVDKTTAYLGVGVGTTFVLIIFVLFLL